MTCSWGLSQMADDFRDVKYVFGDLGDQDVLMIVGGHRQKNIGMVNATLLEVVLHHGFCGKHNADPRVGGHAFKAVPLIA